MTLRYDRSRIHWVTYCQTYHWTFSTDPPRSAAGKLKVLEKNTVGHPWVNHDLGVPLSWEIQKIKPFWKVMEKSLIFVCFQEYGKVIFQGKRHGTLHRPSVPCTICGYSSLLVCIYKFTTFFLDVMVVSIREDNLYFSKTF